MDILKELRKNMKKYGITYYLASDADPHMSEYVNEHYKVRKFLSGFTGSNGTIIVTSSKAYLWTDGRYFVQAENELKGSDITLMKMGQKGVPTILSFLSGNIKKNDVIAFDGMTTSIQSGMNIENIALKKGAKLLWDKDIISDIWSDRPIDKAGIIYTLPTKCHGENASDKLVRVRANLLKEEADYQFISKLDDLMWLYNIRGNDIECNPVCYSYSLIGKNKAYICLKNESLNPKIQSYFSKNNVEIIDYSSLSKLISKAKGKILLDDKSNSFAVLKLLEEKGEVIFKPDITEAFKAVKNKTEIKNIKSCYIKDSVALTRFIKYIKENVAKKTSSKKINEYEAAMLLDSYREKIDDFIELSFPTISAYGANAAMMHYEAGKDNAASLKAKGFYLVDSGGQYMSGTTDVTRTIVMGPVTSKMKMHYTKVVTGMLRLLNARFLHGCTGRNLDILARGPLWNIDVDYKCGTGHGIGYILNVHEGPQSIRYSRRAGEEETALEAGMIISDEPGVYIKDEYGIRIENILLCEKGELNDDGQFMYFSPLTMVPIDLDAIDTKYMNADDIKMLNDYHKLVYESLKEYLNREELRWLKKATRKVIK